MKSILMSIKPKWVEKIASGEKTVEVRKSVPKCGTPFKVYMYCTNDRKTTLNVANGKGLGKKGDLYLNGNCYYPYTFGTLNGKVVGEFICDHIIDLSVETVKTDHSEKGGILWNTVLKNACIENDDLVWYLDIKDGYGLHISDLKIYDNPKELSEFRHFVKCNSCKSGYEAAACLYDEKCLVPARLTRPPQSWQFVEEVEE